ncbi:hypothetical protein EOS_32405, partial [Caballeronia mineralivorans PML1(12)]
LARERDAAEARKAARVAASDRSVESTAAEPSGDQPAAQTGAPADDDQAKKRAIIQAAMDRARKKKEELAKLGAGPKNTDALSPEVQAQIDAAEARRRRLGMTRPDEDKSSTPVVDPDHEPGNDNNA